MATGSVFDVKTAIDKFRDYRTLQANSSLTIYVPHFASALVTTSRSSDAHSTLVFVASNSFAILKSTTAISYGMASSTLTVTNSATNSVQVSILNITDTNLVTFNN